MIQLAENLFGSSAQAVIQRGNGIEQEQSGSVDAEAHHFPGIALFRRDHDDHNQTDERRYGADEVADAVESFTVIHGRLSPDQPFKAEADHGVGVQAQGVAVASSQRLTIPG